MLQVQIHAFADDARIPCDGRANQIGAEFENRIGGEGGREALLGQFDAVAFDARELDFKAVSLRAHGLDLNRLTRRLRGSDNGFGREVERNAEDVCIFNVEEVFFIEVVGLAAKRASDDLFAEELGAKSADAEDVGDGVRIPAFRQHGHRDDTADGAAELAVLAHGVHDLTQQLLVADVVRCTGIPGALNDLAAETGNLIGGHATKLIVEGVASFQLLTVNQQCVRTRERIPP